MPHLRLSAHLRATPAADQCSSGRFLHRAAVPADVQTADGSLPKLKRWLALHRHGNPYWQRPAYGKRADDIPADTQLLVWERTDGAFGVLLPLCDGDWRATLRGTRGGVAFDVRGGLQPTSAMSLRVAYTEAGDDPLALIERASAAAARALRTFRLREEKGTPAILDSLGWCTWDAFYHEVSHDKIREGLRTLHAAGIRPGFLVLDDGWLDVTGDSLNDFAAQPAKFPGGLAGAARMAKTEFGVRHFGVWHAFQGYWAGVNPAKFGRRYPLLRTRGNIRPWQKKSSDLCWIDPEAVARFYHDFYRWLHQQGVDFTKVDGQSALEVFSGGKRGRVSTMARYQEALQGAAFAHFGASPIHCMSNGSDVAFHLSASNLWRNSDDFFPRQPLEAQQRHVHMNAVNNAWTRTFAFPDWDMFQSAGPAPEFHAAARALSGGPIYLCDKPGEHRPEIVRKLAAQDGRVLRFPQPAWPHHETLFTDFANEPKLLRIENRTPLLSVTGFFHCTKTTENIVEKFALPSAGHAMYLHERGCVARGVETELSLAPAGFEIATLCQCVKGWAVFGLLDKYAGAAAVSEWQVAADGRSARAMFAQGGRAGFCVPRKPARVRCDGKAARFSHEPVSGLLTLDTGVESSEPMVVTLFL